MFFRITDRMGNVPLSPRPLYRNGLRPGNLPAQPS